MASHYWLIAAPKGKGNQRTGDPLSSLKKTLEAAGQREPVVKFDVPDLKVGTLDALLALSDDLTKVDLQVESITRKIATQLVDLPGNKDAPLNVGGDAFLGHFAWDLARYNIAESIGELSKKIRAQVGKLEEELRTKSSEYHSLNQSIAVVERQRSGNLVQRTLIGLVDKKDFVVTENLTTLFVVIPKFGYKDWEAKYETLCEFVLPRSSKKIYEDKEHGLFSVVLFQRKVEEFKHKAREERFFVRDFTLADLEAQAQQGDEAKRLELTLDDQQPSKKEDPKLRKLLMQEFGHLGQGQFGAKDEEESGHLDKDFYPYVYTAIDVDYRSTR